MNDLKDYLTQTVHDLKVNLSVCEMAVNRLEDEMEIANKLLYQIEQMKFRIDQALFITRANHYSEDILSENVNLEQVVKEAIGDNAEFLINKGISIQNDFSRTISSAIKSGSITLSPRSSTTAASIRGKTERLTSTAGRMNGHITCILEITASASRKKNLTVSSIKGLPAQTAETAPNQPAWACTMPKKWPTN
jgi:hypothetical protein